MRFLSISAAVLTMGAAQLFGAAADGKAVYDSKCKMCHAADGSGNKGLAASMKVTLRPLGGAEVQAKSDAELKKIITGGVGKMKAQTLTAQQTNDVVAFLRTLKK